MSYLIAGVRPVDIPLSFAQQRLWFLAQIPGLSRAYHISGRLSLRGPLDRDALRRALDRILVRHEALRTTFERLDGRPVPRIAERETCRFQLLEQEVASPEELEQLAREEAGLPFDLERGPLVRGRLIREAEDRHTLLVTMHHIVADGWSRGILIRELSALVSAYTHGEPDPLPELPVQFADYALWQRQWLTAERLQGQAEHWRAALAGAPALLELPLDHPRPAKQDHAGGWVDFELEEGLRSALKELSRRHGTTLFMTLLAGWAILLSRLSGQEEVVIGVPTANRGQAEIKGLIGFFVNTLALRVDLSGSPTVAELLTRVKERVLVAQANQDLPFEQVVERVNPARSLSHSPVFQVMFSLQNAATEVLEVRGLSPEPLVRVFPDAAKLDLGLSLWKEDGRIQGGLEYAAPLFERETAERWLGYFRTLLAAMVADEAMPVDLLEFLPEAERRLVLDTWNATGTDYPAERCVHQLFEAQVSRTPEAVALVFGEQTLSYAELNARANRLAHHLRTMGVQPDARVALCMERSMDQVVGLLAVLKAGGAYVPLDPAYPAERLRHMLADSEPVVLLTQGDLASGWAEAVPVLDLGDAFADQPATDPDPAEVGLTSRHLAYVIYTSGSTGTPKGVMVEHKGLCNLVTAQSQRFGVVTGNRVLQIASFSFDACIFEILMALCGGASLHLPPQGVHLAGEVLGRLIDLYAITHATLTPAVLASLPDQDVLASLQTLIIAGDALKGTLVRRWAPGRCLFNAYGPTEATVWATLHRCREEAHCDPPIGRPIANVRIYILDGRGQPVPIGVAGELHIGGAGVARGYLNRPELTAERFLANPFSAEPDARMFRTGDLGRWLADGTIEFLGRNDFQVKLRGFRIELGEIEVRLRDFPEVREALVVAREEGPGEKRLVAYYTSGQEMGAEALRAHLSASLPEYMVPAAFVRLEALPLTPNGKLDRKALPAPGGDAYAVHGYEPPLGEIETLLAGIWSELLQLERVGRFDNFFERGGHSLLAVQLVSRLRRVLGLEVPIGDLFAHPVLAHFARRLAQAARPQLPPVTAAARPDRIPLSFAQQRLWFLAQLPGVSEAYHIAGGLRLRGPLDRDALRRALDRILTRHEALRTTFGLRDGEPEQRIAGVGTCRFQLLEQAAADPAELGRLAAEEAGLPFDLERGPLVRGRLLREAADRHTLLITMHHIVADGWSMGILVKELGALVRAYAKGEPDPLPELGVQVADHALWQRQWLTAERLQDQVAYWQAALAGAPARLQLPLDHPRPLLQDHTGGRVAFELDAGLTEGLKQLGRRRGATLFMTLLAGWAALLSRLSAQDDVVIGVPTANRGQAEIEGLIGFFVNTLALRLDLAACTVAELLVRVKEQVLAAQANQDLPFEQVVERVNPARSLSHSPLFQVMFAWQNAEAGVFELPGLSLESLAGVFPGPAKFDLSLSLREANGRIQGGLEYALALFERETAERWLGYFRTLLAAMVADEAMPVDRLEFLPEAERRLVLDTWNATGADYPAERCVHQLFEAQVSRNPEAVALVFGEQTLSYAELNARANRLAHHLRMLGVQPDARVALCMERSLDQVVGLLAVLKAGGAYVPLDPAYPPERLRHMLADSEPVVLLTQGDLTSGWAEAVPVLDLGDAFADQPATDPDPAEVGLTSRHLAYVIYTSGSTGTPKGVMVEHKGLCNLVTAQSQRFGVGTGNRVLQIASFSFDASIFEMLMALCGGASLHLPPQGVHLAGEVLGRLIDLYAITHATLTPAVLASLPDQDVLASLRTLILAGDALKGTLVRRWAPGRCLFNAYGPTEATVWATLHRCREEAHCDPPIGRPIANVRIYILDGRGQPVPIGVAGELHIGGAGVARGYLNRPELTAERFLADPFSAEPDARMFRTGDLGRWLADGTIEFLGRNDFQVKLRGFRIELGEIEARLREYPEVRETVVVAREEGPGDQRLVAYYTSGQKLGAEALRAHLSASLPEYMVPAAFVRLEALPLTPHGKLDRKALPPPGGDAYAVRAYAPPEGEVEVALARIWAELLKVERVGRFDSFFELGGHSLLMVRMVTACQQASLGFSLADAYASPTLAALASRMTGPMGQHAADSAILVRAGSGSPIFLMHDGQPSILYAFQLAPHLAAGVPVYALPPSPQDAWPAITVQGLATRLVRLIRQVQPQGPYRLAGWSFGGILAYETAFQLLGEDEKVEFLGLLDTPYGAGGYVAPPLGMPVHLFPALEPGGLMLPRTWQDVVREGALHVVPVSGTHHSMLQAPHLEALGGKISMALDEAAGDRLETWGRDVPLVPLQAAQSGLSSEIRN